VKKLLFLNQNLPAESNFRRKMVDAARIPVFLNLAMCFLKPEANDPVAACQYCTDVLALQPENVKAVFRRGQGQLARSNLKVCFLDIEFVL
jgi:hypothetical protein